MAVDAGSCVDVVRRLAVMAADLELEHEYRDGRQLVPEFRSIRTEDVSNAYYFGRLQHVGPQRRSCILCGGCQNVLTISAHEFFVHHWMQHGGKHDDRRF
jgi:hypothetical protein